MTEQFSGVSAVHNGVLTLRDQPDPYAKLPALARRLGVEPFRSGAASVLLTTQAGESYDLFDLMSALLDRIDAAAP